MVERGATAFAAHVSPDESEETVVVSQFGGEAPEHLADRAAARLETVARADRTIQKAVVLLAPHRDEASRFARLALLRSVIAHTEHEDAASVSLVLGTRGDEDPALQEDLLSLVDGLVTDARSRSLPIRVCFPGGSSTLPQEAAR